MNRALVVALVLAAHGATAAEDPRGVMAEVQRRAQVESEQYEGLLRVVEAGGRTSEKGWVYRRIGSHGASRTLIRFTSPAEVKGVALLVVSYPDRVSDQWMWTPAINRERRVAVQDRRSRFFGTDFSFEDLEERDVEQFDYELLGEEAVEGEACWKIAATPRPGKRSQYARSIYWVRKATYTYAQIEGYDQSRPVRRLSYRRMERIQGIWTARSLEVQDLARGSRTLLTFEAVKYNEPLPADEFTVQALRRD